MRVLVTRPLEEAQETARLLAVAGHQALVSPLMRIVHCEDAPLAPPYQAILATSRHALPPLARHGWARTTPLLCVGDKTAGIACDLGFTAVRSASGDVDALRLLARNTLDPAAAPLLYAAGTTRTGALEEKLAGDGFQVSLALMYRAEPAGGLDPAAIAALETGEAGAVLVASPRSARLLLAALRQAGLEEAAQTMLFACLSPAIAAVLEEAGIRHIRIAKAPDIKSLIDMLA